MELKIDDIINRCNELKGLLLLVKAESEPDNEYIMQQISEKASEIVKYTEQLIKIQPYSKDNMDKAEYPPKNELNEYTHLNPTEDKAWDNDHIQDDDISPEISTETEDYDNIIADDNLSEPDIHFEDNVEVKTEKESKEESLNNVGEERTMPITVDVKLAQQNSKDLKKAFTINDRFRFKRELFGNSDNDFVDAINLVSAMQSLTEAEEYFYEDLGWDSESEEVQEFMSIIINHFS